MIKDYSSTTNIFSEAKDYFLNSAKEHDGQEKMCILSLSYGKDSIACLGAIEQLGWKLDRIVHAEVWATDTIPADPPPMIEFKEKADKIIKERYGIEVEHMYATDKEGNKLTYEYYFYKPRGFTRRKDLPVPPMYGFPYQKGPWCNDRLKLNALKQIPNKDVIRYVGIAKDEPKRLARLEGTNSVSPLEAIGWDESTCRKWCEEHDLLSPIYTTGTRGGCWFCHCQPIDQLRLVRKNYPEYWQLLLKWDSDSPVPFHPDGHTVHDFERRFALEDRGKAPMDKKFRWNKMDKYDLE